MPEKYEKQVEEILEQAGVPPGRGLTHRKKPGFWRLLWTYIGKALGGGAWAITPGRVMLASVVLLLLALVLRAGSVSAIIGLAGLLMFIVAYAMFFMRPRNRVEKRWRGRPVEEEDDGWWDRIRKR